MQNGYWLNGKMEFNQILKINTDFDNKSIKIKNYWKEKLKKKTQELRINFIYLEDSPQSIEKSRARDLKISPKIEKMIANPMSLKSEDSEHSLVPFFRIRAFAFSKMSPKMIDKLPLNSSTFQLFNHGFGGEWCEEQSDN